jgi:hypothetical protein
MKTSRLLILVLVIALHAGQAGAAVISVEEFNAQSENWNSYAQGQLSFTLEGRYSSVSRNNLRLKNCDLAFRPEKGKEIPKPLGDSTRVEVAGKLILDGGKPVFIVERLRDLPSDLEEVRKRAASLRREKHEDWYALGAWTRSRGAFYKDASLEEEADDFLKKGIEAERRAIPEDKPEQYLSLASKVVQLKLSERLREELVHQGHRNIWDAERKARPDRLREIAEQMARDLAGAEVALEPPAPRLEERYAKEPLTAYEAASGEERRKIHRLLYSAVTVARIEGGATADGSNGLSIAETIDRDVPERHALAEMYREKELTFRLGKIGTATRAEVDALAKLYEDREEKELARKAIQTWLSKREELARKDGPDALKLLADEHLRLLKDPKKAVELLLEAWKQSPDSEEIAQQLEKLGYRQKDGKWMTLAEFNAIPVDPILKAMSRGDVVIGMTSTQVKKSLGAPNSITKVVSADDTAEIWTYGARNTTRLSVHILRRHRSTAEGKVIEIQKAQ